MQCQGCALSVSQPLRDVFCLERAVLKVQVTIDQLGNFAGGAWFPNFVQRSRNMVAETTTRIGNLLHRWFHRLEELPQPGLRCLPRLRGNGNRHGGSSRTRRQQLREHVSYCLRVVLSSFANQCVRTLESPRSFHLHFPVIICGSSRTRRQQLREHVSYCLRVVLSSFANQSVRTLESPRSFHLHFPVIICTRSYN